MSVSETEGPAGEFLTVNARNQILAHFLGET